MAYVHLKKSLQRGKKEFHGYQGYFPAYNTYKKDEGTSVMSMAFKSLQRGKKEFNGYEGFFQVTPPTRNKNEKI